LFSGDCVVVEGVLTRKRAASDRYSRISSLCAMAFCVVSANGLSRLARSARFDIVASAATGVEATDVEATGRFA
jgi:hypothetical protein